MRIKVKKTYPKENKDNQPKIGEVRKVVRFAILPKRINGYNVFLERYVDVYIFGKVVEREYELEHKIGSHKIGPYKLVESLNWKFTKREFYERGNKSK